MVFCYKIITESPRRPGLSPRKKASACDVRSSISQLIRSFDYENCNTDIVDAIPEKEWRLLAVLARKREEDIERDNLANQFRQLWQKEREERAILESETLHQYRRYIDEKRREEKSRHEYMQYQKALESQIKRQELLECIRHKEQRSADLLAQIDDEKTCCLVGRAFEEEARIQLAADRRTRMDEAEQFRKHVELIDKQRKVDNAMQKRTKLLRDAAQRVAINNALSSWESSLLRQEVTAMDAARRAHHAANAALTDARSVRLMRARDARRRRAKCLAVVTEQLRDAIKFGR